MPRRILAFIVASILSRLYQILFRMIQDRISALNYYQFCYIQSVQYPLYPSVGAALVEISYDIENAVAILFAYTPF